MRLSYRLVDPLPAEQLERLVALIDGGARVKPQEAV